MKNNKKLNIIPIYSYLRGFSREIYFAEKLRLKQIKRDSWGLILVNCALFLTSLIKKFDISACIFITSEIVLFFNVMYYKTNSLPDIEVLHETACNEYENFLKEEQRDKYYILTLSVIQKDLGRLNALKSKILNLACWISILGLFFSALRW